jgi:transcriptional regulator with XRE-family HTH domain
MPRRPEPLEDRKALAAEIGMRIRTLRIERGMTQDALAKPKFSKAYISALETGIARPSMNSLAYIAEKLGVAPSELLEDATATAVELAGLPELAWVRIAEGRVYVELEDGREVGLPISEPRLRQAPVEALGEWTIGGGGRVIRWEALGVELRVGELFGLRAGETEGARSTREIGERLRTARERRSLTQAQLASPRFTAQYVSQIERGAVKPSVGALSHFADRLRIRRAELLGSAGVARQPTIPPATAVSVRLIGQRLHVELSDGRDLGIPIELFPRLMRATLDELDAWKIARNGAAVRWSQLGFEFLIDEFAGPSLSVDG